MKKISLLFLIAATTFANKVFSQTPGDVVFSLKSGYLFGMEGGKAKVYNKGGFLKTGAGKFPTGVAPNNPYSGQPPISTVKDAPQSAVAPDPLIAFSKTTDIDDAQCNMKPLSSPFIGVGIHYNINEHFKVGAVFDYIIPNPVSIDSYTYAGTTYKLLDTMISVQGIRSLASIELTIPLDRRFFSAYVRAAGGHMVMRANAKAGSNDITINGQGNILNVVQSGNINSAIMMIEADANTNFTSNQDVYGDLQFIGNKDYSVVGSRNVVVKDTVKDKAERKAAAKGFNGKEDISAISKIYSEHKTTHGWTTDLALGVNFTYKSFTTSVGAMIDIMPQAYSNNRAILIQNGIPKTTIGFGSETQVDGNILEVQSFMPSFSPNNMAFGLELSFSLLL